MEEDITPEEKAKKILGISIPTSPVDPEKVNNRREYDFDGIGIDNSFSTNENKKSS